MHQRLELAAWRQANPWRWNPALLLRHLLFIWGHNSFMHVWNTEIVNGSFVSLSWVLGLWVLDFILIRGLRWGVELLNEYVPIIPFLIFCSEAQCYYGFQKVQALLYLLWSEKILNYLVTIWWSSVQGADNINKA